MSDIKVSINGLETIQRNLQHLTPDMKLKIDNTLGQTALQCQTAARKLCPVGTPESTHKKGYRGGRLRASIRFRKVAELAYEVFTDVYYAVWVHEGTRRMHARPFLRTAWQDSQEKLIKRFIQILKTDWSQA